MTFLRTMVEQRLYSVYTRTNLEFKSSIFWRFANLNTAASGTLQTKRQHFPDALKPKPRSTPTFVICDEITVMCWNENRDVYALSTLYCDLLCMV